MAWTAPATAIVAGLVSASFWNINWTENIKSLGLHVHSDGEVDIGCLPGRGHDR